MSIVMLSDVVIKFRLPSSLAHANSFASTLLSFAFLSRLIDSTCVDYSLDSSIHCTVWTLLVFVHY